jgi:hypothetical protein
MVEGIVGPYLVPKREKARDRIELAKSDAEDCRHFEAAEWWNGFLTGARSWPDFVKQLKRNGPELLTKLPDEVPSVRPESGKDVVQVLRSITTDSVVLGTKSDDEYRDYERAMHGDVEKSIQEGYLRAIECAQHYIYIESQMFISSGFPDASGDVENTIARHLYWKIRSKIAKRQWFHVYVLLPEIYDGDPHAAAPKEIQRYQWQTMTRLRDAVQKLVPAGRSASEYLSFYALRAVGRSTDGQDMIRSNLVYVHSKLMIIDDVALTMGSANINDRSMTGYRDSELNVAVLGQRDKEMNLGSRKWRGNGRIQEFRQNLWKEHLGRFAGPMVFENPSQPQTVAFIQKRARENFEKFDKLYDAEMTISDSMGHYRSLCRQQESHVRDHGQRSAKLDQEIAAIAPQLEAAHQTILELYDQLKDQGHLISHPFDQAHRKESKGEMSTGVPHLITT